MFHRERIVQNEIIANKMRKFFWTLQCKYRPAPEVVAKSYGKFLWDSEKMRLSQSLVEILVDEKLSSRSRFYVGLSTGDGSPTFDDLTKRTALISDTLLLSHDWTGRFHQIGVQEYPGGNGFPYVPADRQFAFANATLGPLHGETNDLTKMYGMHCPSLAGLGQWILDAKPLLKAGLVWYLPSYSTSSYETIRGNRIPPGEVKQVKAIDYLIRDGRAVDASGAEPIKSQLVRPVLRADLPFVEGVNLREFGKITIEEFNSYSAFRDFLRQSFLEIDMSLNSVDSDRQLVKLGLQIKDHVRSVRSEMEKVQRKRAVGASGAVIGSLGAILVAVYGPALEAALAVIGASGGVWGIIHAATENSTRALKEDKWYYVWVLAQKSNVHVI